MTAGRLTVAGRGFPLYPCFYLGTHMPSWLWDGQILMRCCGAGVASADKHSHPQSDAPRLTYRTRQAHTADGMRSPAHSV
jgi:hypothetical protein